MSELETLREHAKQMAKHARHGANCLMKPIGGLGCADVADHAAHEWEDVWLHRLRRCPGRCRGCITDAERALWQQIADEVDGYLGHPDAGQEALL